MKKFIIMVITAAFLFTSATMSFANSDKLHGKDVAQGTQQQIGNQPTQQQAQNIKSHKVSFKISGSPVIKYGRYKLPINPVTKGMGATVTFDKTKALLTVVKGTTTIAIDFINKTVIVNGAAVTNSGLFTAKNDKKMTVLIKFIANTLGVRTNVVGDKVEVEVPGLDAPTNVAVATSGGTAAANTLNASTLYLTATANIVAGQATGGKAELYVGSTLVATDAAIAATDTTVTFTTSDGTPVNAELQALIPAGGTVTVKLYNAANKSVTSLVGNPVLVVDYVLPTITGVTSAEYNPVNGIITINVTGAGAVADKVDVTKITLNDTNPDQPKTYQLTNNATTGSAGVVNNADKLVINLGSVDKLGLTGFGTTALTLSIAPGSLLLDAAGNGSTNFTATQIVPVTVVNSNP